MARIDFARRAYDDLRRLRLWLAGKSPAAAERASLAITESISHLADFPLMGPRVADGEVRELKVRFGRYGYVVRYVGNYETVLITRIFHSREER
jgi:plasmid stabilization system protein ParE